MYRSAAVLAKGRTAVPASRVALAFRRSIEGIETGQVYRVW